MPQNRSTLLIADDDANFRNIISNRLVRKNYHVAVAGSGSEAIQLCRDHNFDVALLDLRLPDISGIQLLKELKGLDEKLDIVIMTGYPSVDTAVEAMSIGAFHYLKKPFQLTELEALLTRIWNQSQKAIAHSDDSKLHQNLHEKIAGKSKAIEQVRRLIEKVADSEAPVLVLGESGSGKELVARALHNQSIRVNDPFVTINCAALQESLLESELFGHVKGAFTGAIKDKKGLLEVANNGTLFIDEIAEMSPNLQTKLLRALDRGEFRRVGDTSNISANVRLVSATNKDLEQAIENKSFREDLFFRINVITIRIPPLRERREDIPDLTDHFIQRHFAKTGQKIEISPTALELLWHHDWPGNVRELFNVLQRAVVLANGEFITEQDLPTLSHHHPETQARVAITPLAELEKNQILLALRIMSGNKTQAAKSLGISRRQLYRLMKKHNVF